MLRKLILASVLGLGMGMGATVQADSNPKHSCRYRWVTEYRQVTCHESRRVPYTMNCIRYDECGHPYEVTQVQYREVQVPVTRTVAVRKKISVCE